MRPTRAQLAAGPVLGLALALLIPGTGCQGDHDKSPVGTDDSSDPTDDSAPDGDSDSADDSGHDSDSDSAPTDPLAGPAVAFVGDTSNYRYLWARMDDGTVLHELDMAALDPVACGPAPCATLHSEASVDPSTGLDVAVLSYMPTVPAVSELGVLSKVQVGPDGDSVLWRIRNLDFLTNFSASPELCAQTAPCTVPDGDEDVRRKCMLFLPHTVAIASESDTEVELWVADTYTPSRALKIKLDKSTECGVVEEVISGATSPDWEGYDNVNDVNIQSDTEILLSTRTAKGILGAANTSYWEKLDGVWRQRWRYPAGEGYLAAAHDPDLIEGTDGQQYLIYANSNALGIHQRTDEFDETDNLGTIGVARLGAEGPEYLYDAVVPGGFGFTRSTEMLADGSFLVTDAGCMIQASYCDNEGALWRINLPDMTTAVAPGLGGSFTPNHRDMQYVVAEVVSTSWASPFHCGFGILFSAQYLNEGALGEVMTARLDDAESTCPME